VSDENPTTSFMQAMERIEDGGRTYPDPPTLREIAERNASHYSNLAYHIEHGRNGELPIRCVLTLPNAKLPRRAHEGDSGMDLYAPEDVVLQPGIPRFVDTGVVLELPRGYEGQIRSRSGLTKQGVTACSGLGTVDSSYRGNIGVTLLWHTQPGNGGEDTWTLEAGSRIAQLVIMPVPRVELVEVESVEQLSKTERSDKGFGSSGQ
jgi:dUTP pyrophosphatase